MHLKALNAVKPGAQDMRFLALTSMGSLCATLVFAFSPSQASAFPNVFVPKCSSLFEPTEPVHQPSLRDFPILKYVYRDERARAALLTVQRNVFQTPAGDTAAVKKLENSWNKRELKVEEQTAIYFELLEEFLDHNRHEVVGNSALMAWYTTHGALASRIPGFQKNLVEWYERTKSPAARQRIAIMLFDIASLPTVRFNPETLAFFDRMPLEQKLSFVKQVRETSSLHNPEAQTYFTMWARSLDLIQRKKELEAVLYKTVAEDHARPEALADYVKKNLAPEYSNANILKRLQDAEPLSGVERFANPVTRELARLLQYRVAFGLRYPDTGDTPQSARFVAESADTVLLIISWMSESRMFGMADRDSAHVAKLLGMLTPNEIEYLGRRWPHASRIASDRRITNIFERLTDSLSYTLRNEAAGQAPTTRVTD